ncbi:MAG: response regulator, partial [Pyrinomonadaceae bacterium]
MSAPASNSQNTPTVLIVDPDSAGRQRLSSIFEDAGYRALMATDAPAALRVLSEDRCDLVILDLEMPEGEGLALCRLLRAQPRTTNMPVIALSDNDRESHITAALAAGADDYIAKPSTPGEIVSRASSRLRAVQREWVLTGSNRELRFLADLGRGLLRALEPE